MGPGLGHSARNAIIGLAPTSAAARSGDTSGLSRPKTLSAAKTRRF
jgi:hypothetical protein